MARRPVHMKKTALPPRKRAALKASDFAVPSERKYPINDLFHARLALTYVLSPSNAAYRDEVVSSVLARYPELQFWWAARSRNLAAATRRRPSARKVANPRKHQSATPPLFRGEVVEYKLDDYSATVVVDRIEHKGGSSYLVGYEYEGWAIDLDDPEDIGGPAVRLPLAGAKVTRMNPSHPMKRAQANPSHRLGDSVPARKRNPSLDWEERRTASGVEYVATAPNVQYVIWRYSPSSGFNIDRDYKDLRSYPLRGQMTLTAAKEEAERDLAGLLRKNPSHRSRSNLALRRNTGIAGLEAFIASNLPGSGLKLRSVKSVPADFPTDEAVEVVFDTSYRMRDKYEAEDAVRKAFDDRDAYEMGVDVLETPDNSRVLRAKVSAHKRWFQTHVDAANARERAPGILGPNVGLNADWSSTAYYVAPRNGKPNLTQGAIYLFDTEDDDRWELVQRFDPEDGYETDIRVLEAFDSLKAALDYIESHRDELEQRAHQKANPRRKLPKYGEGSGIISRARRGLGTKYRTMREGMLAEGGDVMRLPHRLPGHEGKSMTDLSEWGREEDYAYNDAKPILDLLASSNKPSLSLRTVVNKLRAQGMSGEEVFEGLTFLRSHDLINYEGGKPISLRQKANPRRNPRNLRVGK